MFRSSTAELSGRSTRFRRARYSDAGGNRFSLLDLLLAYGRASHDHHGHVLFHMDRRALKAALKQRGDGAGPMIERVRGIFAVVGKDGVVITVGHRYRRLRR